MGISIWRMSVFLIIRNMDNTILSTGTRPNHTFAVLAFAFLLLFLQPDAIFWWQAWVQTSVGRLSSIIITTSSPILRNTILSTGTRPNPYLLVCFLVVFLIFLDHFRRTKVQHGYFLVAGVGPIECWLFVEYHHYNFVTTSSPILRNTILSTGTRPNRHFLVCFWLVFLRYLHHFLIKKAPYGPGADQDGPRWLMMAQDGPRRCRRWPQEGSRWPEMAQDGRKMASSWPQDCPKKPQDGPRWPQHGSRWLKVAQDCPAQPGNEPDAR